MTSAGEVTAYGPGSRFGMIHDLLGVTPVVEDIEAATHGDAISFEFILEHNPGILYVFDRDAAIGAEGDSAEVILDNELVHGTDAWQNDNVVYLDTALWYLANSGLSTIPTMINEVGDSLDHSAMMVESSAAMEDSAEGDAAASGEVVIQHAQGETAVPLNPQTVVVLDYSLLDTLDAIGAPVSSVIQGPLMPAHLEKYNGEEYTNAGSLFEPDFEAINALEPDLILVALRSSTSYEPLSEIAPTLDLTPNTLEDAAAYATNLGTVFGKEAEVTEQLNAIDELIASVQEKAAANENNALIVMTSAGEVTAYGPGSRFGMIHDLLGVTPVVEDIEAATHGDAISFEFILEHNPGILYVFDRDAAIGAEGDSAQVILDNALVHGTDAWQNDNVVYLDTALWYLANTGLSTIPTMINEVGDSLGE